jgi:hypothetical protein
MPFYDEFDLSTVDVLLISQYVFSFASWRREQGASHAVGQLGLVWHVPTRYSVYEKQWNTFCIIPIRLCDVTWSPDVTVPLVHMSPHILANSSFRLNPGTSTSLTASVSTLIMQPRCHMSSRRRTSRDASS